MKTLVITLLSCALVGNLLALDSASRITPEIQAELDAQKRTIAQWAASPVLVAAVKAQNKSGPLPGMTNGKWRSLKPNDAIVQTLQQNAASMWLAKKLGASNGLYREAFLSAAKGEKAAFATKPTSYLHANDEKFEKAMTGQSWQGKPEFDKSSRSHVVQISTPVLDRGKPIGVLVVGVAMKTMKEMTR